METKELVVMCSRSDLPAMEGCMKQLDDFKIGYEVRVLCAHRTPNEVIKLSSEATAFVTIPSYGIFKKSPLQIFLKYYSIEKQKNLLIKIRFLYIM